MSGEWHNKSVEFLLHFTKIPKIWKIRRTFCLIFRSTVNLKIRRTDHTAYNIGRTIQIVRNRPKHIFCWQQNLPPPLNGMEVFFFFKLGFWRIFLSASTEDAHSSERHRCGMLTCRACETSAEEIWTQYAYSILVIFAKVDMFEKRVLNFVLISLFLNFKIIKAEEHRQQTILWPWVFLRSCPLLIYGFWLRLHNFYEELL